MEQRKVQSVLQESEMISMDLDVHNIVKTLLVNEDNVAKTPLLRDVDDGEFYLIQDGIFEDEEGDIIIPIKHL